MTGELEAIIDSVFCIAKGGLPLRQIFMRNHPSLEEKPEASAVHIQILTTWFDAGTIEYVCRWHRLLQCILAAGQYERTRSHSCG